MPRWYLLDDGPMPGPLNMSRDEYIFRQVRENPEKIILRTYSFDPPCISIGYHQAPEKVLDIEAVASGGVGLVRRITGGRALLHRDEFTYCVCASSESSLFGRSLNETFSLIANVLIRALRSIGVEAELSGGSNHGTEKWDMSPCLASVSRHEVTAGGKKIIASAQRRWQGLFLQHGSILLGPGSRQIEEYLPGNWRSLGDHMTSVSEQAGFMPGYEQVRDAVLAEFAGLIGAEYGLLTLSDSDRDEIDCAAAAKSLIIE